MPSPDLSHDTAEPTDSGEPGHPERFTLGEVVPCEAPLSDVVYLEVGEAMGLQGGEFDPLEHSEGGVAAVADLDQDGDLDIVLGFRDEPAVLYTREGDRFIRSHLPYDENPLWFVLTDVDVDGQLDLIVAGMEPALLQYTPEGWTTTLLPTPPPELGGVSTKGMVSGDLNGDGAPDLYAINSVLHPDLVAARDHILLNDGAGGFEAHAFLVPEEFGLRHGFDAHWFDYDGDGDLDIFVVNEMTGLRTLVPDLSVDGTFLLVNEDGVLRSANEECFCELIVDGMGVDVGDGNRDGLPDIFIGATNSTTLLEMWEDRSYVDVTLSRNVNPMEVARGAMAWGVRYLDFDNDGLQDFLVAEGDLWHEYSVDPQVLAQPTELLRQLPGEPIEYEDVTEEYGFGTLGSWRTIVAMDHNGDGILDPLITDVYRRPYLYMSQGCTANGWLTVEAPPASKVELTIDGVTQTAWVSTHSSYGGAMAPEVHFGMGTATAVDRLEVTLPTGEHLVAPGSIDGRRRVRVQ